MTIITGIVWALRDVERTLELRAQSQESMIPILYGLPDFQYVDVEGSAQGNINSVGLNNQNRPWRCWKSAGARDFNPEQEIYGFQRIVPIRRSGCARERAGEYFFR